MTDQPPESASEGSPQTSPPGLPGWVKLFAIAVAVLVVIVIVVLIAGGGEHGPGRH